MTPTTESRRWPLAIGLGLLFVVLVNVALAWIAIRGADPVVSTYITPVTALKAARPRAVSARCPHCGTAVEGDARPLLLPGLRDGGRDHPRRRARALLRRARGLRPRPEPIAAGWGAVPTETAGDGSASVRLVIDNLRCASCVWVTEAVLQRTPGVLDATVSYATGRATLRWDPARTNLPALASRIAQLGYRPRPLGTEAQPDRDLAVRLGISAFAAMNIMLLAASVYTGWWEAMEPRWAMLFRWTHAGAGHPGRTLVRQAVLHRRLVGAAPRPAAHGPADRAGGGAALRPRLRGDAAGPGRLPRLAGDAGDPPPGRPDARGPGKKARRRGRHRAGLDPAGDGTEGNGAWHRGRTGDGTGRRRPDRPRQRRGDPGRRRGRRGRRTGPDGAGDRRGRSRRGRAGQPGRGRSRCRGRGTHRRGRAGGRRYPAPPDGPRAGPGRRPRAGADGGRPDRALVHPRHADRRDGHRDRLVPRGGHRGGDRAHRGGAGGGLPLRPRALAAAGRRSGTRCHRPPRPPAPLGRSAAGAGRGGHRGARQDRYGDRRPSPGDLGQRRGAPDRGRAGAVQRPPDRPGDPGRGGPAGHSAAAGDGGGGDGGNRDPGRDRRTALGREGGRAGRRESLSSRTRMAHHSSSGWATGCARTRRAR